MKYYMYTHNGQGSDEKMLVTTYAGMKSYIASQKQIGLMVSPHDFEETDGSETGLAPCALEWIMQKDGAWWFFPQGGPVHCEGCDEYCATRTGEQ